MKKIIILSLFILQSLNGLSSYILIPMDETQKNHLKAYGIAYWSIKGELQIQWLVNYRGGSFLIPNAKPVTTECTVRGVSFEIISDAQGHSILEDIANPEVNQDVVKLEKAPRVAVYSPKTKQPWDDAVTLVLKYAEIPYNVVYDEEILSDQLKDYDWLHLHHEDFTGQYGRFYASYKQAAWYQLQVKDDEAMAKKIRLHKSFSIKISGCKKK